MESPQRRRFAAAAAMTLVLAPLAACGKAGGGDVDIDLDGPKFVMDARGAGAEWKPKIVNDTGAKLTEVVLTFTIEDPGGDLPAMEFDNEAVTPQEECMDEDGEIDPDCVEHDERLKKQDCQVPGTRDEEQRFGRTLTCEGDIPAGEREYLLYPGIIDLDMDNAGELVDYPDLKLSAELAVAGETFAASSAQIGISGTEKYQRISFDDVPEKLASDRVAPDGVDWSVTITNDTDADRVGLELSMDVIYYGFVEIGTSHPGCHHPDGLKGKIDCGKVDIAAGESLTVEMTMYAISDQQDLDVNCHEKNGLCRRSGVDVVVGDGQGIFAEDVAIVRLKPVG